MCNACGVTGFIHNRSPRVRSSPSSERPGALEFNTFGVSPLIFGVVAEKEQLGTPWLKDILEIHGWKLYNPLYSGSIRHRAAEFLFGGSMANESLAIAFRTCAPEAFRRFLVDQGNVILRVPAHSSEVGDLLVYDDGDELTVEVGKIDHRHFEVYCDSASTLEERQANVCTSAAEWIEAVIADRVRFRNEFSRGRIIAGMSWYGDSQDAGRLLESTDEWREFTWTGLKLHQRRQIA